MPGTRPHGPLGAFYQQGPLAAVQSSGPLLWEWREQRDPFREPCARFNVRTVRDTYAKNSPLRETG